MSIRIGTTTRALSPGEIFTRLGLASISRATARAPAEEEFVYKVFVLGARGSGKTVFLASLYNKLSVQDGDNRYFVQPTSEKQRSSLVKAFEQIANPNANWPAGTSKIDEYVFRCLHEAPGRVEPFSLFAFKYLDYPGGYVTDDMGEAHDDRALDIETQTEVAHAILVLLDGQKIYEQLEEYDGAGPSIDYDLNSIVPRLSAGAKKPVHFLVTKWDVLQGLHNLEAVRQQLLKNQAFANFVQQRRKESMPVHLVPVSAVGNDFAKFDPVAKTMSKRKGARVAPYNIEYSVGLTMTDQLMLLGQLVGQQAANGKIPLCLVKWLRNGVKCAWLIAWYLNLEELSFPGIPINLRAFRILELLTRFEQTLGQEEDALAAQVERICARIRDEASAVQSIIEIQALRCKQLQSKFPASSLTEAAQTWT
jgi:Double-GTPase 2